MKAKQSKRPTVYKEEEFEEFIAAIDGDNIENWKIIAEALNVDQETIVRWKKLPRARAAIKNAINRSLTDMRKTGSRDWRMHRENAKIHGVRDKQELDVTSGGEKIQPILGGNTNVLSDDSDKQASKT